MQDEGVKYTIDASHVNIKATLANYMPPLVEFIGNMDFAWSTVNKRFIEHMVKRHEDYIVGGNYLQVPITF